MSDRSASETRQHKQYRREYGQNLSVWMLPETVAALRYRASQDCVSMSELMRAGVALVLGYCPTCLRPLSKDEP